MKYAGWLFSIYVSFLSVCTMQSTMCTMQKLFLDSVCQMFLPCFPSKCESISACCHHPMTYVFFMEYAIMICYVFKPTVTGPKKFLPSKGKLPQIRRQKFLGLEMEGLLIESSQAQHTSFQIKKCNNTIIIKNMFLPSLEWEKISLPWVSTLAHGSETLVPMCEYDKSFVFLSR